MAGIYPSFDALTSEARSLLIPRGTDRKNSYYCVSKIGYSNYISDVRGSFIVSVDIKTTFFLDDRNKMAVL